MKLSAYLPTDKNPFTGTKELTPPVKVRIKFLPERYFSKTSMLGETRADYLEKMRADGIQLHKTYSAIRVDGYGDVADLVVINDNGEEKPFMAFLFRDADESLGE